MFAAANAGYYPGHGHAISSQSVVHHDEGLVLGNIAAPAYYGAPLLQTAPLTYYAAPAVYDEHYGGHDEYVSTRSIVIKYFQLIF